MSKILRRLGVLVALTFAALATMAVPASAHNSLVSSDPADGAELRSGLSTVSLAFAKAVPLDSLTVRVSTAEGSTRVDNVVSSDSAKKVVYFDLNPAVTGPVTVYWKLVGSDGHAVSGSTKFTINAIASASTASAASTPPTITPRLPANLSETASNDEATGAPGALRWLLRYASYLGMITIAGVLLTSALVWEPARDHPGLRRLLTAAFAVTAVCTGLQAVILASDIGGTRAWSAVTTSDVGISLAVRAVLLLVLAALIYSSTHVLERQERDIAEIVLTLLILATWAFAGHSKSMRWAALGVPLDVVHHLAAAAWLGGLGIVTFIVIPHTNRATSVECIQRFARLAAVSVTVLVATGVVQTLRMSDNPFDHVRGNHGRILIAKLAVVAGMLKVADLNRRRVAKNLQAPQTVKPATLANLRNAMRIELGLGLLVIAITSALVTTPPGIRATREPTFQQIDARSERGDIRAIHE